MKFKVGNKVRVNKLSPFSFVGKEGYITEVRKGKHYLYSAKVGKCDWLFATKELDLIEEVRNE